MSSTREPHKDRPSNRKSVLLGIAALLVGAGLFVAMILVVVVVYFSTQDPVGQYLSEQQSALADTYAMQMVPAGEYAIRCTAGQGDSCQDRERPRHTVLLTQPYLIGETEVTQGLYVSIMGNNPSGFPDCGMDCPVEKLNWYKIVGFANALSSHHGLPACYRIREQTVTMHNGLHCGGFRLPTEAEWEVAARGGEDLKFSGSNNIDEVAWYDANSNEMTHPVAQKAPNGYGLYDMSGNVYEWTWDTYAEQATMLREDPFMQNGETRSARGGSWGGKGEWTRVSSRGSLDPALQSSNVGFRLVLAAPPPE